MIANIDSPTPETAFRSEKVDYLSHFSEGQSGTIVDLILEPELQGRLMGMGLFAGTRFRVLQGGNSSKTKSSARPILLAIGDTRIALGQSVASKILVEK
ncbi:MAG: ferrous iron transport protein A [Planctomycetaceae bacterium]|jgi:Fe2+ transport system protein FeoA|nr:ferrous iron transport protein A [Planctomycetaceae bacterium]